MRLQVKSRLYEFQSTFILRINLYKFFFLQGRNFFVLDLLIELLLLYEFVLEE